MIRPIYLIYRRHEDVVELIHREYTEEDAAEFCRQMNEQWDKMGWHYSYHLSQ